MIIYKSSSKCCYNLSSQNYNLKQIDNAFVFCANKTHYIWLCIIKCTGHVDFKKLLTWSPNFVTPISVYSSHGGFKQILGMITRCANLSCT